MFLPFWDPTMVLLIPALILAAYAQAILSANGIPDVTVEPGQGYLSDHYDPIK